MHILLVNKIKITFKASDEPEIGPDLTRFGPVYVRIDPCFILIAHLDLKILIYEPVFVNLFREGNEVFSFDATAEDFGLFVFEIFSFENFLGKISFINRVRKWVRLLVLFHPPWSTFIYI